MITSLYADGGVILRNPSPIGGTYAYAILGDDGEDFRGSGILHAGSVDTECVTNNQTEMLAVLSGMSLLPNDFAGTVYSDSQVTLGRVFLGWKWKNIPAWMHRKYQEQRARLVNWEFIKFVLLDGHPTQAQLDAGIGKRGNPVSSFNVWCDKECWRLALKFLEDQHVSKQQN